MVGRRDGEKEVEKARRREGGREAGEEGRRERKIFSKINLYNEVYFLEVCQVVCSIIGNKMIKDIGKI